MLLKQFFSKEAADVLLGRIRPAMIFPDESPGLFDPVRDDLLTFLLSNGHIHCSHFSWYVRDEIGAKESDIAYRVRLCWPQDLWTSIFDGILRDILNGADGFSLKGPLLVRPLGRRDARKAIFEYMLATNLVTTSDVADAVHAALIDFGKSQAKTVIEQNIFPDECGSPESLGYALANNAVKRTSLRYRYNESARYYIERSKSLLQDVMDQLFTVAALV